VHEDPAEVVPLRDRGAAAEDPPPLGVAFFVLITLFPFYYIIVLSMREISEVVESPGIDLHRPR
jgi:hypothetical protein